MEYSAWLKQAIDAIQHYDAVPAWRCLKAYKALETSGQIPSEKRNEIGQLRQRLLYVALPVLPLADAQKMLSSSVLGFLQHEPDLEDRLEVRFAYRGYHEKAEDMNALGAAMRLNEEKIGGVPIKEWITRFEKIFPAERRTTNSPIEFMTKDSAIVRLSKNEQQLVRALVSAYSNWVSGGKAGQAVATSQGMIANQPTQTVRLPLLKAMNTYKRLSEQILTNEKIKLKTAPEPVRPSLGNWLRSYREELGIGFHEPVKRGNFLFQSQNGKRLSNDDRARLNLILKSVEEDFPLEIDTNRQVILFPRTSDASMELAQVNTQAMRRANQSPTRPTPPKASSLGSLFAKTVAPEKNVSGETLHFSTGHVLPAEQDAGAKQVIKPPTVPPGPRRDTRTPLTHSPYSIRPLRSRGDDGSGTP